MGYLDMLFEWRRFSEKHIRGKSKQNTNLSINDIAHTSQQVDQIEQVWQADLWAISIRMVEFRLEKPYSPPRFCCYFSGKIWKKVHFL